MITPVLMAGGFGSRLWPLSRVHYPKQFIPLVNDNTMLQNTIKRLDDLPQNPAIIICNDEHRFMVAEQLRELGKKNSSIILEPVSRSTAPAVALAAFHAIKDGSDPLLLILPADHLIVDEELFIETINKATTAAEEGMLVTFGIIPTHPETGYGYIKQGEPFDSNTFIVDCFVEKPDFSTAKDYISQKSYCWNSGIFLFKASSYLSELKKYNAEVYNICKKTINSSYVDLDFIRISTEIFLSCPNDSIDYAIMEKTDKAVIIPMNVGWSDVGSWSSLWDVNKKDFSGNVINGDVIADTTTNSYISSQSRLVATIGIDDLVIVETKDAVLVARKDKVQYVKNIVEQLKNEKRSEYLQHQEIFCHWGKNENISEGDRYNVKKIVVRPGKSTKTQIHYHRAEHWVVVSGTAKVTNGNKEYFITENQSTYIPVASPHSFENPGKIDLELIEVRTGNYLSEDDIQRIDEKNEG